MHRIHVIKVPTTNNKLFPYSHYNDYNHDPYLNAYKKDGELVIECEDLFKLKPNVQSKKRNRIDIYIPSKSALDLGVEIVSFFGAGNVAVLNEINPENYRVGQQTLPIIEESRRVSYKKAHVSIAGFDVTGEKNNIYIDRESPNEGHIEMVGPEVHLGIPLKCVLGNLDNSTVIEQNVPQNELRVEGEKNPIKKAKGNVCIILSKEQARNLASTLIYYAQYR